MSESQSPDRKKPDPLLGMDLGNYRISELIGEGGMGAVYAARHPVLGREVAVKVLARMLCDDEDFLARFRQEALAANKVGHEVIVEAIDFGTLPDGRSYYVMERLQGESLGDLMERRICLPLGELAQILLPVMEALQAAHDAGIIHRDLKPDNIFLHRGRRDAIEPKLLDFGLAKLTKVDPSEAGVATQTGLLLGTPLYMPPEQFSGKPETLGPWTDVYALGGVIFHVLTGKPPYDVHGFADLLMEHMMGPIPSVCDLRPELPLALDDVLRCALGKKPEERYRSMAELRDAFARVVALASGEDVAVAPRHPAPIPEPDRTAKPSSAAHAISLALRPPTQSPTPGRAPEAADEPFVPRKKASSADVPTVAERVDPAVMSSLRLPEPEAEAALDPEVPADTARLRPPKPVAAPAQEVAATPEEPEEPAPPETAETPPPKDFRAMDPSAERFPPVAAAEPEEEVEPDEEPEPTHHGAGGRTLGILIVLAVAAAGFAYWQLAREKPSERGDLQVKTLPADALIRVDAEPNWAPAPIRRSLRPGRHKLTVKKAGYDQLTTWAKIRSGEKTTLTLTLLPADGATPERPRPRPDARPTPPSRPPPGVDTPPVMAGDDVGMRPGPRPTVGGTPHAMAPRPRPHGAMSTRPTPPEPRPMSGMAVSLGSLLKMPADIGAAVRRLYPRLKSCYAKAVNDPKLLKAIPRISLVVAPNGRVRSARVGPASVGSSVVGRCLKRKVSAWKLPTHHAAYTYSFGVRFSTH